MSPSVQRLGQGERERGDRYWQVAVWMLIAAYIAFFGALTTLKHESFQTTAFDLGNVDQAVWNTRHGRLLAMTNIEGLTNRLGTHVEPVLIPISLLYFLWSDPRVLLLLQTTIIALGAWPLYHLARRALQRKGLKPENAAGASRLAFRALPLTFALVYLLFPALQSANYFDFHAVALAPTFFLAAFYCLETERWGWYAFFALLTMSCKEDMPLLVVMMGIYAGLVRQHWLVGLATVGAALVWFAATVGWIMPHFDPQGVSPLSSRYAYLGESPLEIVTTLVTQPSRWLSALLTVQSLAYLRDLLIPVAFLALFAPQVLMLAVPSLLTNLLSTDGFMHQLEGFHYGITLVPVVVVAAAYGTAWLLQRLPGWRPLPVVLCAIILTSTLLYHREHGYSPLAAAYPGSWPVTTDHHRLGAKMAKNIPSEASLATLPHSNPHGSQRQSLSMIERLENGLPAPLHNAEYIWFDVTNSWPLHPNDLKTGIEGLLADDYGIDQADQGWLLLRRGAPEKELPSTFFDFARVPDPQPEYPLRLQFLLAGRPVLESLGFDLVLDSPLSSPDSQQSLVRLYWRTLEPLPPGLRLYPFYVDDATGQTLEDTTLRPMAATLWYPPDQWQVGEVVTTSMLPWDVGRNFSLGLGIVQGSNWEEVENRLPILLDFSDSVVRLFDDNTWARLLRVEDGHPVAEPRVFDSPSPQHPLDNTFGEQIDLLGFDLKPSTHKMKVTLYWQAKKRLDTSYTVFAQLLDPTGQIRAQVDVVPKGGGYPTVWWLPGEVVADSFSLELPPDTPHDEPYRLIVGLYDPTTGARLPVADTGLDYVELTRIEP